MGDIQQIGNFNSLLNYTIDHFTPSGSLCYFKENGINLGWYIQNLIDESDDEFDNPLSEENWMLQTNWKFIKYVIHYKHLMTPKQLKKKPIESIIKIDHEELDTEEVESNKDEEESTTSTEISEENSKSYTSTEATEDSKPIETSQVHIVLNKTTHDEVIHLETNL